MGPPFSPHHNSQAANMNTHPDGIIPPDLSQDNGISSSGSSASSQHPVTSIVTTGPDGTTIDEASQQSTISNASAGKEIKKFPIYQVNNIYFIQKFLIFFLK